MSPLWYLYDQSFLFFLEYYILFPDLWNRICSIFVTVVVYDFSASSASASSATCICRRYMAEILPIRRKHHIINQSINQSATCIPLKLAALILYNSLLIEWSIWSLLWWYPVILVMLVKIRHFNFLFRSSSKRSNQRYIFSTSVVRIEFSHLKDEDSPYMSLLSAPIKGRFQ